MYIMIQYELWTTIRIPPSLEHAVWSGQTPTFAVVVMNLLQILMIPLICWSE